MPKSKIHQNPSSRSPLHRRYGRAGWIGALAVMALGCDNRGAADLGQVGQIGQASLPAGSSLSVSINSLESDRAKSGVAFVDYPISTKIGFVSSGTANRVNFTVMLMEKPAPGASDADLLNLKSCWLGGGNAMVKGDGSQQYLEVNTRLPPACNDDGSPHVYNYEVVLDPDETETTEDNRLLVFNDRESAAAPNQLCKTTDPVTGALKAGCVINIAAQPAPGLDIEMTRVLPSSSVGLLYPPGQHPFVPAGGSEAPRPLLSANIELAAYGRDHNTPDAATLPGNVDLSYSIRAKSDPTGAGWKALISNPEGSYAPLGSIKPGAKQQVTAHLHPSDDFRTLTSPGGAWAAVTDFLVQACASVPFPEAGDPMVAGPDGRQNNCKQFPIQLVKKSFQTTLASSYTANMTPVSESWGSSDTIGVSLDATSNNYFDTTGAYSDSEVKVSVDSMLGDFNVFDLWGNGSATLSPASAAIDVGVQLFGYDWYTYSNSASSLTWDNDKSFTKSSCSEYTFTAVVVPVDVEFCISGSAGLDMALTVTTTKLTPSVRPYASISATASASVDLVVYKAGIEGSVTILGINTGSSDGISGTLSMTVNSLSPVKLTVSASMAATFSITTLSASLDVYVQELEIKYCSKKIFGVKIKYPCGTDYDTLWSYTIASYSGKTYSTQLLNKTFTSQTLQ